MVEAIPSIADELVEVLGPAIPAYRTLEGPFGRDVMQAAAETVAVLADALFALPARPPARVLRRDPGRPRGAVGHRLVAG